MLGCRNRWKRHARSLAPADRVSPGSRSHPRSLVRLSARRERSPDWTRRWVVIRCCRRLPSRLEAVRRQAAVDGHLIDPWHLAAMLEGLRMRMDECAMRIIDRGVIFEAARHALALHQWLIAPDFDQEGEVHRAAAALATPQADASPLLSAAIEMHAWLERGGARPPIRAALVRYWTVHHLFRAPVPLTGASALRAETAGNVMHGRRRSDRARRRSG